MSDYSTHPEWLGLLGDVIASPADDAPRLIAADWLEDWGDGARAEFIRVQVEWAAIGLLHPPADAEDRRIIRRAKALDGRARQLLLKHWAAWVPTWNENTSYEVILGDKWEYTNTPGVVFARGFPGEVRCPLQTWQQHGPAIVRAHPVERVVATCRVPEERHHVYPEPHLCRCGWTWAGMNAPWDDYFARFPACIPKPIWDLMRQSKVPFSDYATPEEAAEDLALALPAWARLPGDQR